MTAFTGNNLSELLAPLARHSQQSIAALSQKSTEELLQLLDAIPIPPSPPRWQDEVIVNHLREKRSVLDLGCGSGDLLRALAAHGIRGQGVELNSEAVMTCIEHGVAVIHADLGEGLNSFPDDSVDAVVCEQTLQTLVRPVDMLREMLRVGREALASFPNFGYWRIRLDLALRGRMPSSKGLPHRWYNTPNIHLFTIADFKDWFQQHGYVIDTGWVLVEGTVRPYQQDDNLLAEEALFVLKSATK
jgi:methionine biosynthesis protein MetW